MFNPDNLLDDDQVLTLKKFAESCTISLATARRLLRKKQGPKTTRLSARRIGIRRRDLRDWLDRRGES